MKRYHFLLSFLTAVLLLASCSGGDMSFKIDGKGLLSMTAGGKTEIAPSPVGMISVDDVLKVPLSARTTSDRIVLSYEEGDVVLSKKIREDGSLRLEVIEIPEGIDTFFFGPYSCPDCSDVGDIVGAAWHADGSLVCIQSLNPKTVGQFVGTGSLPKTNETGFPGPGLKVAYLDGDNAVLSCHADNFTRPRVVSVGAFKNVVAEAIPAPEGAIEGAAVAILRADDSDSMLDKICQLEIEERLPHPTIDGQWAKTSPHAADIYFDFGDPDIEAQIRIVQKAGANWIYFSDPFESWGHFDVSKVKYPEGDAQFKAAADRALSKGVNVGTHTLSNFIHTYDKYVTPVPHKDLLCFDPTPIKADISATSTEIFIGEVLNYAARTTLNLVRIGDELIKTGGFDADRLCLTGCLRGAHGTVAQAHPAGSIITHMSDHGYATLYPNHALQSEMAENIGNFMSRFGLRRLSFDGLEGCHATGHGELGTNTFVKKVFDCVGGDLICDASIPSHYRWHALSYFNWGEPWYDSDRRGGNYNYRAANQDYFHKNLLPGMLGWYKVCNSDRRYEPTLPETLEFIMSRTVAFQAGLLLSYSIGESPKADKYLEMVKNWQEFRFSVDVPDEIRERMKVQRTEWHLDKNDTKWTLSEMFIQEFDLGYTDRKKTIIQMESGTSSYQPWGNYGSSHFSNCIIDRATYDKTVEPITEPAHYRIRVGTPEQSGQLHSLAFCGGWYGSEILRFDDVTANAGDYLEYFGGKTLCRFDKDYNLVETYEGVGQELLYRSTGGSVSVKYNLSNDDLIMTMKHFRTVQKFEF